MSNKVCVPRGRYVLKMRNSYGNGMCCDSGDGYYIVYLDRTELVCSSHFTYTKLHTIQVDPYFERGAICEEACGMECYVDPAAYYHHLGVPRFRMLLLVRMTCSWGARATRRASTLGTGVGQPGGGVGPCPASCMRPGS